MRREEMRREEIVESTLPVATNDTYSHHSVYNQDKEHEIIMSDFFAQVKPFDLIVFRNTGAIGKIISFVEWLACGDGSISHVGCVINSDVCPLIEGDELYILESNIDFGSSSIGISVATNNKRGTIGVQIRQLKNTITTTLAKGGSIGWCPLYDNCNPVNQRQFESCEAYNKRLDNLKWETSRFYYQYSHMLYDLNPLSLLGGAFPFMRKARDKVINKMKFLNMHKWMFCSELVALLYIRLGIIPASIIPSDVIPVDFISGVDIDGMHSPVMRPRWIKIE